MRTDEEVVQVCSGDDSGHRSECQGGDKNVRYWYDVGSYLGLNVVCTNPHSHHPVDMLIGTKTRSLRSLPHTKRYTRNRSVRSFSLTRRGSIDASMVSRTYHKQWSRLSKPPLPVDVWQQGTTRVTCCNNPQTISQSAVQGSS